MYTATPTQSPPIVLTFGISDPSGAGGIQLDLLTNAAMGCHTVSVITGISTQDSAVMESSYAIQVEHIDDQARCLLEDMPIRAIKIAGVYESATIDTIAGILADYPDIPVILHITSDNVHAESSFHEDHNQRLTEYYLKNLSPFSQLTVINAHLLHRHSQHNDTKTDVDSGIEKLLKQGCQHVLTLGYDRSPESIINQLNSLEKNSKQFSHQRRALNFKGAGHTLAAAYSALIAQGLSPEEACQEAHNYTELCLHNGFRPGMGRVFLDHFFWAKAHTEH